MSVMAEAIEQCSAQAMHQRLGMSRWLMAAGLIALNAGQWNMKLMSAKQHHSTLNLDAERRGVVPLGIRPKLNELHAQRKCHGEVTKKKPDW